MRTRWLAALVVGPATLALASVAPHLAAVSTRSPAVRAMSEVRGELGVAGEGAFEMALQKMSRTTCRLSGYPRLDLIEGDAVVGTAAPDALGGDGPPNRPGPTPGSSPVPDSPWVTLAPGGHAWVRVIYQADSADGTPCQAVDAVRITVAHRRGSVQVPVSFRPCGEVGVTVFTPAP